MSIRTKLWTLAIISICGLVILSVVAITGMVTAEGSMKTASENEQLATYVLNLKNDLLQARIGFVYTLVLRDRDKILAKKDEAEKALSDLETNLAKAQVLVKSSTEESTLLKQFDEGVQNYRAQARIMVDKMLAATASGNTSQFTEASSFATSQVAPLYPKAAEKIDQMVQHQTKETEEHITSTTKNLHTKNIAMVTITLIIGVVVAGLGIYIPRSIIHPIKKTTDVLTDLAQGDGDLARRLDASGKDEIADMARQFNAFVDKLHGILTNVRQNVTEIASAASQMSSSSMAMASGTEEVAQQASTVATASEQMAATTTEIAMNCHSAVTSASGANEAARNGGEIVQNTIRVMSEITHQVEQSAATIGTLGTQADQIGAIVGTIQDIADQTNLLALNAAIEAARAGEQGRGFAVVADEVRALAERTTKATKEISTMILSIQNETRAVVTTMEEAVYAVQRGSNEAAQSGSAIEEIMVQIDGVTNQINQIATAAEEQSATTTEISNNMLQITQVIQEAATSAQESAEATQMLTATATNLESQVAQFKL